MHTRARAHTHELDLSLVPESLHADLSLFSVNIAFLVLTCLDLALALAAYGRLLALPPWHVSSSTAMPALVFVCVCVYACMCKRGRTGEGAGGGEREGEREGGRGKGRREGGMDRLT